MDRVNSFDTRMRSSSLGSRDRSSHCKVGKTHERMRRVEANRMPCHGTGAVLAVNSLVAAWTLLCAIASSNSREGCVLGLASLFHRDRASISLSVLVVLLLRRQQGVSGAGGRLPRLRRPLTAAVCAVGTTVALVTASE